MRILPLFLALPLLASAVACGSEDMQGGGGEEDILPDAEPPCLDPLPCATWIQDYEKEVVSRITGHSELREGLKLEQRFTEAEREEVRLYLEDELRTYGLEPERHLYGTGENVFAVLPSTVPGGARVLLGCHYDSIEGSPAAGDDGTGVALVLAAARYFASLDERENEMIFIFFDEEEKGLIGSQAYAERARLENPPLVAAHIYDLISWDEDGDGAVELWSPAPELEQMYRQVGEERGIAVQVVDFESSDHASFIGNNIPTVGVSEEFVSGDHNPNYHTPEDLYEHIDFDYLESISRLSFEVTGLAHE